MEPNIRDIIAKAEDLSKKISSLRNEKTLPTIELDIILLDIRTLYEDIKNLQATSSWSVSREPEPVSATPEIVPETKVPENKGSKTEAPSVDVPEERAPKVEAPTIEVPKEKIPEVEIPSAKVSEEKVAEVEIPPVEVPKNKPSKTKASEKSPGQTTLADKYKSEKKYINESLAGNRGNNDISSKIQSKPIENIGSALGVNDRFTLINDLFNGDKDSFQNTVSVLDNSPNFNEAFNYITSSFEWDMEEESVQLLLDLVRRKFIVNQNE